MAKKSEHLKRFVRKRGVTYFLPRLAKIVFNRISLLLDNISSDLHQMNGQFS